MIGGWWVFGETLWEEALPERTIIKEILARRMFADGSKTELELTIKEAETFKDPATGKVYKINVQGDLDIYGKKGHIRTVKKIR